MRLEAIDTIYHDGGHNAFTDIVHWRDRYWVCFRHATSHRGTDAGIYVISSPDLTDWSAPAAAIDTPEDNRDPKLFVLGDRLFVTSMTIKRSFEFPETHSGEISTDDFFSLVSYTDDGINWSEPRRVWEPFKGLWWAEPHGGRVYGSGYLHKPVDEQGNLQPGSSTYQADRSEFVVTDDGLHWETVSVIGHERRPTECALAFLPDERAAAFLRHDVEEAPFPEILVADPPYTEWRTVYQFEYATNGPCLGMVGNCLVASSRAFLDWDSTPREVRRLAEPGAVRGIQIMTVDIDRGEVRPALVISCPPHPEDDWPDTSYAGILDLGEGRFSMSYYEGLKAAYSDIKLARLRL